MVSSASLGIYYGNLRPRSGYWWIYKLQSNNINLSFQILCGDTSVEQFHTRVLIESRAAPENLVIQNEHNAQNKMWWRWRSGIQNGEERDTGQCEEGQQLLPTFSTPVMTYQWSRAKPLFEPDGGTTPSHCRPLWLTLGVTALSAAQRERRALRWVEML